ncbi:MULTISPECIES: DUF4062 domain-containing protein [unclassified Acidovorax]|uniref:DUF4062 domain-containing protein n=1 Tax=unclassified Acidovorax TaxID=2684926 RepID=UPI000BCD9FB3|nr:MULTISPECIES: DUF4062 domain-containing protein [unclassified Acidovorax]HQS65245.1 DUF4062 domain-containing protein [Acidovorax defluvii]OYZ45746.1 MAG: hypothetical protein B7Y20_05960 [Acidovorax sp. 16-64-162]OZA66766.1 MAG: hypothetical protein B7X70_19185 [Acidovorax sp. 39-64-12]HQT18099.1 DUF4062 domain-containing protein [Acidovorax defluvii]HQT50357.1 DUF4062 domain-containing protein [Acidovorax defluvii]
MKRRLQIFISSTYIDLIPERQAAVAAILKSGHIPAGMELFTAGDRSQMDTIKQWIDESDVYMLILGGRYGSVEPTSGISYTELEYDYAVQQSKPLFAVVITDGSLEQKVKSGGTAFLEKENPKELALFRNKVLSNISSFFDDTKDIKLCVHETLADFAANRSLKGWVQADEVIDTKPLFDEIKKLADENRELKDAISELEKRPATQSNKQAETFKELRKVLAGIEVKVPANLADGKESTSDLLSIFYGNRDTLVSGVTNQNGAGAAESFFFFNVCPKLQVHGLAINEKVAGVRYRRYAVTALGSAFLANMEKQFVLAKQQQDEQQKDKPDMPTASIPVKKAPAKKAAKIK